MKRRESLDLQGSWSDYLRPNNQHSSLQKEPEEIQLRQSSKKFKHSSLTSPKKVIYTDLVFLKYQDQYLKLDTFSKQSHSALLHSKSSESQEIQNKQFTSSEREDLKNAFRYICRLIFKEANNNLPEIKKIAENQGEDFKMWSKEIQSKIKALFDDAELISGERYFKEYSENLSKQDRVIVIKYMLWFLRVKYLRHLRGSTSGERGKRKQMRKDLYIRYKNQVMAPYLLDALKKAETQ